jgi:L-lactate utilization protein LutB
MNAAQIKQYCGTKIAEITKDAPKPTAQPGQMGLFRKISKVIDYQIIPTKEVVNKTATALKANGFETEIVNNKEQALELIKRIIPQGASVMNGASTTLIEIGLTDYLKTKQHGWNNLHKAIVEEKDSKKQSLLRKQASLADYFISGANAISETGEIVIASGSGSQLPAIAYNSDNIILVVSTNKITPSLDEAISRLRNYVLPLEDAKIKSLGHAAGTMLSKILIYEKHPVGYGKKVLIILVNEKLGF